MAEQTEEINQPSPEELQYIHQRWAQLNALAKESADRAVKYLLLTNAGGAIATLSFLGAVEQLRAQLAPQFALGCFIFGIIAIGMNTALWVHHVERLSTNWREGTLAVFQGKLDFDSLSERDDAIAYNTKWLWFTGYASFIAFILGAAVGLFGLNFT